MKRSPNPNTGKLSWFLKPAGRKFVFYTATTTAIALFAGNFTPQTFGLQYYRDFVQCYENGMPREVPEKVLRRLKAAMDKLDVQEYERKLIKPFTVFGFDLFTAGSTKYRFGCALGIPVNYAYSSVEDIQRNEIKFRDKSINWSSDIGKMLEDAIILTEDEQIFGLCRSILQLQTHRPLLNSIFASLSFVGMYAVGNFFNLRLNLYTRPLSLRLVMYSILGLFGIGSWSFMKDFNQVNYDTTIDKQLSALGPDFIQSGLGFYDKLLKKNMALRELLGDDTYTARGNENYLLRQKSLPLTIRKSFFEERWKEVHAQSKPDVQ